jgi:hypothetical protein
MLHIIYIVRLTTVPLFDLTPDAPVTVPVLLLPRCGLV